MLPKINPTTTNAWKKLEEYYFGFEGTHMRDIFANDTERFQKYSLNTAHQEDLQNCNYNEQEKGRRYQQHRECIHPGLCV